MTTESHAARTPDPRLDEIETLITQARRGDLATETALSRIVALARREDTGEVYQKPWG